MLEVTDVYEVQNDIVMIIRRRRWRSGSGWRKEYSRAGVSPIAFVSHFLLKPFGAFVCGGVEGCMLSRV